MFVCIIYKSPLFGKRHRGRKLGGTCRNVVYACPCIGVKKHHFALVFVDLHCFEKTKGNSGPKLHPAFVHCAWLLRAALDHLHFENLFYQKQCKLAMSALYRFL